MRRIVLITAMAIAGCGGSETLFTTSGAGGSGGTTSSAGGATTGGTGGAAGTTGGTGGTGGCKSNADCDDGDACTVDVCQFNGECAHAVTGGCTGSGGSGGTTGSGASGGSGGTTGSGGMPSGSGGSGGSMPTCGALDVDDDGDGFSEAQGDCDDCNAAANPGAAELRDAGMGVDDDCNGIIDDVAGTCDAALALDDADPKHGAAAIDLCNVASAQDKKWGVLSAAYTRANGAAGAGALQWGIMSTFGANVTPKMGDHMLALSTGHARDADDPNACNGTDCTTNFGAVSVAGFPQNVPNCPSPSPSIRDDVALSLTIRVPTNVTGYAFNFRFYTFDYPEWVCTSTMDQFMAIAQPPPAASPNGALILDDVLRPPCAAFKYMYVCNGCLLGAGDLAGTGFDTWGTGAGTPWLTTTAPVKAGSTLSVRFAIWDLSDTASDSTALVDNFRWITDPDVALLTQ